MPVTRVKEENSTLISSGTSTLSACVDISALSGDTYPSLWQLAIFWNNTLSNLKSEFIYYGIIIEKNGLFA